MGDFNGDRQIDIAYADYENEGVTVLLNTGVASFSPTTPLNFEKQAIGKTSTPQSVKLTNTGELKIQSMKASAEFAVTSTCGARVAPGADCTISATFSPTKQGAQQGTISIIDNASSKPQVIELLGTGDQSTTTLPATAQKKRPHFWGHVSRGQNLVGNGQERRCKCPFQPLERYFGNW